MKNNYLVWAEKWNHESQRNTVIAHVWNSHTIEGLFVSCCGGHYIEPKGMPHPCHHALSLADVPNTAQHIHNHWRGLPPRSPNPTPSEDWHRRIVFLFCARSCPRSHPSVCMVLPKRSLCRCPCKQKSCLVPLQGLCPPSFCQDFAYCCSGAGILGIDRCMYTCNTCTTRCITGNFHNKNFQK